MDVRNYYNRYFLFIKNNNVKKSVIDIFKVKKKIGINLKKLTFIVYCRIIILNTILQPLR